MPSLIFGLQNFGLDARCPRLSARGSRTKAQARGSGRKFRAEAYLQTQNVGPVELTESISRGISPQVDQNTDTSFIARVHMQGLKHVNSKTRRTQRRAPTVAVQLASVCQLSSS